MPMDLKKLFNFSRAPINVPANEKVIEQTSNTLTVEFTDGVQLSWSQKVLPNTGLREPWKNFYKWYFSRAMSESYTFNYENDNDRGETMIRRRDIKRFNVSIQDQNKSVSRK